MVLSVLHFKLLIPAEILWIDSIIIPALQLIKLRHRFKKFRKGKSQASHSSSWALVSTFNSLYHLCM